MIVIYFLACLLTSNLSAETQVEMTTIKNASPGEILLEDSMVPVQKKEILANTNSGSAQNSIENQVALPSQHGSQPGTLGQLRGYSGSAEDIDVQTLGISLNSPAGGGFDFSTFPQFLWSNYSFKLGPPLNSLNPTASTGTLSLIPRTMRALGQKQPSTQVMGFYSSAGVSQISALGAYNGSTATVVGYSQFKVMGPSASLSSQWQKGLYHGYFHLIATDLEAQSPGPTFDPSPLARSRVTRIIPVIQNDFHFNHHQVLKTSLFYDFNSMGYRNEEKFVLADNSTEQLGIASVYLEKDWKFGLNYRQVKYQIKDDNILIRTQMMNMGTLQASKKWEIGAISVEPTYQGIWITSYGLLSQGSFGTRLKMNRSEDALFSRWSVTRRVPSLMDRYFDLKNRQFTGNPNLKAETNWTSLIGSELRRKNLNFVLQSYCQIRRNARVLSEGTIINQGTATVFAINGITHLKLSRYLGLEDSWTFARTRFLVTGLEFPFIPSFLNVFGMNIHSSGDSKRWSGFIASRFSTRAINDVFNHNNRASKYSIFDLGVRVALARGIFLAGRIENAFDRRIELIKGYPTGRSLSFMLAGEL